MEYTYKLVMIWRAIIGIAICFCSYSWWHLHHITAPPTIKVGILFSRTGTLGHVEGGIIDTTLLAIQEINEKGGLLGVTIEPVIVDGRSDWGLYSTIAEQLIVQDGVKAIFGCWLSSEEKAVRPIIEKHNNILFYPAYYEGLEASRNIVYTGAAVNQKMIPAPLWMMRQFGKRIFLLGTESVYPRVTNKLMRELLPQLGGTIVGEMYLDVGQENVDPIVAQIASAKPDVIINSIGGSVNALLYKKLKKLGQETHIFSYAVQDSEYEAVGLDAVASTYILGNYSPSLTTAANRAFLKLFEQSYSGRVVSDDMESGYLGVHLWAQAVRKAGSFDPDKVIAALPQTTYQAPHGLVSIASHQLLLYQSAFIAKVTPQGHDDIIWSAAAIAPHVYPTDLFISSMITLSGPQAWGDYLASLYKSWGNQWAK